MRALIPVLVLVACAGLAEAAAGKDADRPLERYSPVLRYDASEGHFAQPVMREGEPSDDDRVYGREVVDDGKLWLQYWLFFEYNSQDRGLFKTGRHEGDWELLQLQLNTAGQPRFATFAQHSWAEACDYGEVETVKEGGAEVPVVYVANGSHALYPRAGTADRPWPDPNDEADGDGREVRPGLVPIADGSPEWVDDPEPWGDSRAGIVPGEQSSPHGPQFAPDDRWSEPAAFHADVGRGCGAGPPGRWWQTALTVAFALAVLLLVARAVRRRRAARAVS